MRKRLATPMTTPVAIRALEALAAQGGGGGRHSSRPNPVPSSVHPVPSSVEAPSPSSVEAPSPSEVATFGAHLQEMSGTAVDSKNAPVCFTAGLSALTALWIALTAGGGADVLMSSTAYGGSSQVGLLTYLLTCLLAYLLTFLLTFFLTYLLTFLLTYDPTTPPAGDRPSWGTYACLGHTRTCIRACICLLQVTDLLGARAPVGLHKYTFDLQGGAQITHSVQGALSRIKDAYGAKKAKGPPPRAAVATTVLFVEAPTNPDMKVRGPH